MAAIGPKIERQTVNDIAIRIVFAVASHGRQEVASQIKKAPPIVVADLAKEGRLAEPNDNVEKASETRNSVASNGHSPIGSNAASKINDPVRESLRIKATEWLMAKLRAEMHPKVFSSLPDTDVTFVLKPSECLKDGALYCMLDGKSVRELTRHVRENYGLTWDEYLLLTGLPPLFPKTSLGVSAAIVKMSAEKRAERFLRREEKERREKNEKRKKALAERGHANPKIVMRVEDSITYEKIYCLFDGVGRSMITRHIRKRWGMTRDQYLDYCKLPPDYPRVSEKYSEDKSRKMSNVLNADKKVSGAEREKKRKWALQSKRRTILSVPTRGLVDGEAALPRTLGRPPRKSDGAAAD